MADEKPLGISLQGLLALVDAHGGRLAFAGLSTGAVKRLVLTATGHTRTSYAAQLLALESPYVAPATALICHAYEDEFLGVLDAVAAVVFVMTEGSVLGTACVRTGFGPLSRRPPTTKLAPHAAMNVGLT